MRCGPSDSSAGYPSTGPFAWNGWPDPPGVNRADPQEASVDHHREQHAARVPQIGQIAIHLVGRALAQIALEDLGVVADLLDHVVGPVVGQAEAFAHARSRA